MKFDINKLTLGELKEIHNELNGLFGSEKKSTQEKHSQIGNMVIIRSRDSGVHFGELVSVNARHVVLNKSRRMHRWWSAKESTLTAVAKYGLNLSKDSLNIQSEIEGQEILDACEILPCSQECIESFSKVEPYNEQ